MFSTFMAAFFEATAERSSLSDAAFGLTDEAFDSVDAWSGLDAFVGRNWSLANVALRPAVIESLLLKAFKLFAPILSLLELMPSLLLISSHSFIVALLFGSSRRTLSKFLNASS